MVMLHVAFLLRHVLSSPRSSLHSLQKISRAAAIIVKLCDVHEYIQSFMVRASSTERCSRLVRQIARKMWWIQDRQRHGNIIGGQQWDCSIAADIRLKPSVDGSTSEIVAFCIAFDVLLKSSSARRAIEVGIRRKLMDIVSKLDDGDIEAMLGMLVDPKSEKSPVSVTGHMLLTWTLLSSAETSDSSRAKILMTSAHKYPPAANFAILVTNYGVKTKTLGALLLTLETFGVLCGKEVTVEDLKRFVSIFFDKTEVSPKPQSKHMPNVMSQDAEEDFERILHSNDLESAILKKSGKQQEGIATAYVCTSGDGKARIIRVSDPADSDDLELKAWKEKRVAKGNRDTLRILCAIFKDPAVEANASSVLSPPEKPLKDVVVDTLRSVLDSRIQIPDPEEGDSDSEMYTNPGHKKGNPHTLAWLREK
jgi:hypothetical protein